MALPRDFRGLLGLLKLGAVVNVALLVAVARLPHPDPQVVIPAWILLGVSAFRCLFPNRYLDNVVLHDSPLSSIFLTRVLATFSEVAYIYQFAYVLRALNLDRVGWVDGFAWWMVAQVVVSQGFVWSAIATQRLGRYFYEEVGWFVIFAANTAASAFLLSTLEAPGAGRLLLFLNLVFGAGYLPWQVLHLRSLRRESDAGRGQAVGWREGLREAIHERNPRTDAAAWGGGIGLTWMVAYWAALIPVWVAYVAIVLSSR